MTVDEVFAIRRRGLVATGTVAAGSLRPGDEVSINGSARVRVDAIEAFRKRVDQANPGDSVGLLFSGLEKEHVGPGDVITTWGGETPQFATPLAPLP